MNEDINQEILAELRKMKRIFFCAMLVFIVLGMVPAFYTVFSRGISRAAPSWQSVDTAVRQQDFSKALTEAQALVASQPNYHYGQAYLGVIYLAMNDVKNAEVHFSRAYELFPNEEAEKDLAAVRKRIAAGKDFKLLTK